MSEQTARGGLRERKRQRTRAQLARTAVELIAERGLQQVRVEDICERADVSRSTFFRTFGSKESAFVEGVHLGRLEALVGALRDRPADEPPVDAVRNAMLDAFADWPTELDNLRLEAQIRSESRAVQAWASAQRSTWADAVASALAERFPADDGGLDGAALLAGSAMTALRVAAERWIADGASRSPEPYIDASFDSLRRLWGASVT